MADGYVRAIGGVGVCEATSGPWVSNFVTGLYTALMDSSPVLAITGQNVRAQLDRDAFQAVDIVEIVKSITKKAYCIKDPAKVPWIFHEAFTIPQIRKELERKTDYDDIPIKPQRVFREINVL